MVEIAEKNEELSKREATISEYRDSTKDMHLAHHNDQSVISDLKLELEREKEKVKDRERKLSERDE
jgi:hypothetical protein